MEDGKTLRALRRLLNNRSIPMDYQRMYKLVASKVGSGAVLMDLTAMVKDRSSHLSIVCLHQYHFPYKCRVGNDPTWVLAAELYEMAGNSFQRSAVFNLWLTT